MRPAVLLALRKGDKGRLKGLLHREKDVKMWQRYRLILLCSKRPRRDVAKEANMSYNHLGLIVAAYSKDGIEGLRYKTPPGRPSEIPEKKKEKIISILESSPYGWETKRIKETIIKETGVVYTDRHITRIAHKWGFAMVVPRSENRRMSKPAVYQFKKKRKE
ncbi:MAG: winged helix-turn-helix domain-containing protein [Candidatus Micrarchaeales archaeon]|nr:winged helix-turn-helix domain-containing protein [Candidatus Micrarchaeales archaeon]